MIQGFKYCFDNLLDCPASDDIVLEISNNSAGKIIGYGGCNIKNLRRNNVGITITGYTRRILTISGQDRFKVFGDIIKL